MTNIEFVLNTILDASKNEKYKPTFANSRYGGNPVGLWAGRVLAHKTQAAAEHSIGPAINVRGVVMGTDKWGHFFQVGYWMHAEKMNVPEQVDFGRWLEGEYSLVWGKMPQNPVARVRWAENAKRINDKYMLIGKKYGVDLFPGIFGEASTGVISNADENANMEGAYFYYKLAKHPYTFKFQAKDYRLDLFSEVKVPNTYTNGVTARPWVFDSIDNCTEATPIPGDTRMGNLRDEACSSRSRIPPLPSWAWIILAVGLLACLVMFVWDLLRQLEFMEL